MGLFTVEEVEVADSRLELPVAAEGLRFSYMGTLAVFWLLAAGMGAVGGVVGRRRSAAAQGSAGLVVEVGMS